MTQHTRIDRRHFVGLLGVAAGSAAISWTPSIARAQGWFLGDQILQWTPIAPDAWAMIDPSTGGNSLVVRSGRSVLLIDTKFPHLGGALYEDAIGRTVDPSESELILINTHHHGDHTGGNGSVVPHASASYAHTNALPRIADQLQRIKDGASGAESTVSDADGSPALIKSAKQVSIDAQSWDAKSIVPRNPIEGKKTTVRVGELSVDLYHFGSGHTDNDLVIHIPALNIMHTGDVVFNGLHPYMFPSTGANSGGWMHSAMSAHALCDENTVVIPGHGPLGDRAILTNQRDYFEQLVAAVQNEIDNGVSKEDAAEKSWEFMDGLGFERIRPRAINAIYDELTG